MYYVPGFEMDTKDPKMNKMDVILVGEGHKKKQITLQGRKGLSIERKISKPSHVKETLFHCASIFLQIKAQITVLPLLGFMQSNEAQYWICKI